MVQGREEAEFQLESACGSQGLHQAAGGAAGGQGGRWGVQLRGRGPEGLLPPGRHRSVLEEDAELGHVQRLKGLAFGLNRCVYSPVAFISSHLHVSSSNHLDPKEGWMGGCTFSEEGPFLSASLERVRLSHTVLLPAQNLPCVLGVGTLIFPDAWGLR